MTKIKHRFWVTVIQICIIIAHSISWFQNAIISWESSFNENYEKCKSSKNVFSVCHMNIRSMSKNIKEFETYLDLLKHEFTVIGLTETWLKESNCDLYGIKGYHLIEKHRESQGGGVAVCIEEHLSYFERPDISLFESDLESIFIEIDKEQLRIKKNVIVGTIYRPPGTDIKSFNDKFTILLSDLRKENKICYLIGDFNINLLNHESHGPTGDFFYLMTSNSFLPLISRPTRITATSATLIDNIFTNYLVNCGDSCQGLLVTDVTDHYPIFHINRQMITEESEV